MSIIPPCRRLVQKSIIGSERVTTLSLQPRVTGFKSGSISSPRHFHPSRRHSLTLPDLSKLSPFASTSSDGSGNNDGDRYQERVIMPFSKDLLFDIVSNVDGYSNFVPYCVESRVQPSSEKHINKDTKEFLADLAIGYGQFQESYTSKVTIVDGKSVQATAVPTPFFTRLETQWVFTQQSTESTQVDFTIHYSFSNPLYAAFAKTAMEKMTSRMVDAFKKRANEEQQQQQQQQQHT